MNSSDFDPAVRLAELLVLIKAWVTDEERLSRGFTAAPQPSALAPLLLNEWRTLMTVVENHAQEWPVNTRQDLAQAFEKNLRESNANWSVRHALSTLQRAVAPKETTSLPEQLQLILLNAGCWPNLPTAGRRPANLTLYGPYAMELSRATENRRVDLLRRLLDWKGAGAESQSLLRSFETGAGLPVGFSHMQQTGWTWAVRNLCEEGLRVWLDAGADPNASDKVGRPVLAYAHKVGQVKALLEAGADPLAAHLPIQIRRAHLTAIWQGWASSLHWDLQKEAVEREWEDGIAYLRSRMAAWPEAEAQQATDRIAFSAYNRRFKASDASLGLEALAQALGRRSSLAATDEVELNGRQWSFAGAAARSRLLDQSDRQLPKLPRPAAKRCVGPGVKEATITALAELSANSDEAERTLRQHGPQAVAGALRLLLEDLSTEGHSLGDSVLHRRFAQVLRCAGTLGQNWVQALHSVVDAHFDTLYARWLTSAPQSHVFVREGDTRVALKWLDQQLDNVPLFQQARWALLGLAAYREKDTAPSSEHIRARAVLLGATGAGWDPITLSPEDFTKWEQIRREDPNFAAALDAACAAYRLQTGIVTLTPPKRTQHRL